jgi:uncharacterized membrane protein
VLNRFYHRLANALAGLDRGLQRLATAGLSFLLWPALIAVAVSVGAYGFVHLPSLPTFDTNKLPDPMRRAALIWLAKSAGLVALFYFAVATIGRIVTRSWQFAKTSAELNRWLFGLLALPFVAALCLPKIEQESPKQTLFLIAITAAIAGATTYHWARLFMPSGRPFDADGPDPRSRSNLPFAILSTLGVLILWAGYSYIFSRLSITNHHALTTRTTDLGFYDNIFYQSSHGHPLGCSFVKTGNHISAHFDPILVLLSPIHRLYPRAETLLVLQSVWLGSSVIPVYFLGRRLLESRPGGLALALMVAAYPAMHGANMYEFHSLTLIAPLVLWLLYFLETNARKRYYLILALLCLCREDVSLLMCFVGLYALLSRRPGAASLGRNTILISVAYFLVAKLGFMHSRGVFNAGKDAYSYDYYYDAMNPGRHDIAGLLTSLFINPVFALKTALDEPKLVYLANVFLPVLFLPFFVKTGRLMLIYGLMFTLLASRTPVFTTHFQYTVVLFPIAFTLTAFALRRVQNGQLLTSLGLEPRKLSRALLGAALVSTLLMSWKFGGIVENESFRGGFARITRTLTPAQRDIYAWVNTQASSIPRAASVAVTPKLGPHVSSRMQAYNYPERQDVDYLFMDETELRGGELDRHKKIIGAKEFDEVARRGKMVLYKRQPKKAHPSG